MRPFGTIGGPFGARDPFEHHSPFADQRRTIQRPFGNHSGIIWGPFGDHSGIIRKPTIGGPLEGPSGHHSETIRGPFEHHSGTVRDQSFGDQSGHSQAIKAYDKKTEKEGERRGREVEAPAASAAKRTHNPGSSEPRPKGSGPLG